MNKTKITNLSAVLGIFCIIQCRTIAKSANFDEAIQNVKRIAIVSNVTVTGSFDDERERNSLQEKISAAIQIHGKERLQERGYTVQNLGHDDSLAISMYSESNLNNIHDSLTSGSPLSVNEGIESRNVARSTGMENALVIQVLVDRNNNYSSVCSGIWAMYIIPPLPFEIKFRFGLADLKTGDLIWFQNKARRSYFDDIEPNTVRYLDYVLNQLFSRETGSRTAISSTRS